jgi:tetratricopeptide (TPR) repeat protein
MGDISNRSGGIDVSSGQVSAGGDMAGRDIIKQTQEAPQPIALSLHQLPPPPSDFVGREQEIAELLALVEPGGAIITGLRGMGGIGKTALALVVAHRLTDRYPDAQFFLDLRGVSEKPLSPYEAMAHVVRAYYPTSKLPDTLDEMQALYRSELTGKQALLLMDNAKDAVQIVPLVPPAGCLLLITSRNTFAVPGLKVKDLNLLPPDDARRLLVEIAARIGDCADDIAKLCGYLPQALRASASLIANTIDLDPRDYVMQLRDERQRLRRIGVDESRGLDIEASLNLSYVRLPPETQRVFTQLSVFPADFDAKAAEVVCEDEEHAQVSKLVQLSLVQYSPSPAKGEDRGEGRYSLHDLVRLFAAQRATDADRTAAQYRHAEHYKNVLSTADDLYKQGSENITRGLALFDLEWRNIQAGQAWAANNVRADLGDRETAAQVWQLCNDYPNAGVYVLDLRLHAREQIRWLEAALAAARLLKNRKREGVHLGNLGLAYSALGDVRRAIEFYEQVLTIMREIGNRRGEGNSLGNLGQAYADLGELRKAIEYHERALVIARDIGDKRGEANALGRLGLAYADLGEARKAIEFYEQMLTITREIGDRRGEGTALGALGIAYAALGEPREAIEFCAQALVIARDIGDRSNEGIWLGNLGNAYADLGEARRAIEFYEQALIIDREVGNRRGEGVGLGALGAAYADLGEARQAIEFYNQALIIAYDIGDRLNEGTWLGNLGNAYTILGEPRKAIEFYERHRDIAREIGDQRGEGNALWNMAVSLDKLGERATAIAHAEAALKIFAAIEDPHAEMVLRRLAAWRG